MAKFDDAIVAAYREGVPPREIAARIGMTLQYVYGRAGRLGIGAYAKKARPEKPPKPKPKIVLPELRPCIVSTREPPPRSQRVEMTKSEMLVMLHDAVKNTR